MNEQDKELVEHVLKAAGEAGEKGFGFMVEFTFTTGVVDLFGYLSWMGLAWFLGKKLYNWKASDDGLDIFRAMGLIACAIFFACSICGVATAVAKVISPEGATIHSVVS